MAYTPTTWQDGDIATAEKLNHLEQGVAGLDGSLSVPKGNGLQGMLFAVNTQGNPYIRWTTSGLMMQILFYATTGKYSYQSNDGSGWKSVNPFA